jgi:hypothetical protein
VNINPYIFLTPPLLDAMLKQPMYFVRQYYRRGLNGSESDKIPLLLSHYSHHEIDAERAKRHMRLLWNDKFRFMYDTTNKEHMEKLKIAASQPPGYKIYTNVMMKEWAPPRHIRNNIFHYLKNKVPAEPNFRNEKLRIQLKDLFGEFYLVINWRETKVEVILDELEKAHSYVL